MISRRKHIAASACYHWQMITFHYSAKLFSINNLHITSYLCIGNKKQSNCRIKKDINYGILNE